MRDVARLAGVASAGLRECWEPGKGLRAAEQLGYRANPLVQTLMSSVRRRAVVSEANLAWLEQRRSDRRAIQSMEEGARNRAQVLGFGMEKISLDSELQSGRFREILRARGIVGAVVAPLRDVGQALEVPCDDLDLATFSWWSIFPEIAGIRHPFEALGSNAVDMVVAQVHRNERGIPERPKTMLVEGDWIEGASLRSLTEAVPDVCEQA